MKKTRLIIKDKYNNNKIIAIVDNIDNISVNELQKIIQLHDELGHNWEYQQTD